MSNGVQSFNYPVPTNLKEAGARFSHDTAALADAYADLSKAQLAVDVAMSRLATSARTLKAWALLSEEHIPQWASEARDENAAHEDWLRSKP